MTCALFVFFALLPIIAGAFHPGAAVPTLIFLMVCVYYIAEEPGNFPVRQ